MVNVLEHSSDVQEIVQHWLVESTKFLSMRLPRELARNMVLILPETAPRATV